MSVQRAQHEVTAAEFAEWHAYYLLDPWGEARADLRAGIIASTVANRHRHPTKEKPYEPADFVPRFGPAPRRRQSPQEMQHIFRMVTRAVGGTVNGTSTRRA